MNKYKIFGGKIKFPWMLLCEWPEKFNKLSKQFSGSPFHKTGWEPGVLVCSNSVSYSDISQKEQTQGKNYDQKKILLGFSLALVIVYSIYMVIYMW